MITKSLILALAGVGLLSAEAPDIKLLSGATRIQYNQIKTLLLKTAEKMPEENYSFKPTADVRSFGAIIGHVADSEGYFCSVISGQENPVADAEKLKSKAELTAALKKSFDFCDKAFDGLTDKSEMEVIKVGQNERTRGAIANFSLMHNWEHYGNLVTYMRLKGVVPPSSEKK